MDPGALTDLARQALDQARQALASGDPGAAVQAVTHAFHLLGRAQEATSFSEKVRDALQAGTPSYHAANQLAALLESVGLQATSRPASGGPWVDQASSLGYIPHLASQLGQPIPAVSSGLPPAAESDSMETEVSCHADGSRPLSDLVAEAEGATYICQRCGGAVSALRRQAHDETWCPCLDTG